MCILGALVRVIFFSGVRVKSDGKYFRELFNAKGDRL
jgi:hypothetical protein